MKETPNRRHAAFEDLMGVVERLRDPGGCPWDRKQTHESLRPHLLEECYEVLEAIDARNPDGLANALVRLTDDNEVLEAANRATAPLYIVNPIKKFEERSKNIFDTHPAIEDRVKRLKSLTV